MKIAVGGIFHETNTFSNMRTTRKEFEIHALAMGQEIIEQYQGTRGSLGGVIDAAKEYRLDLVPTIYAGAVPGGPVDDAFFEELVNELCGALPGNLDGILLVLHGAMITDKKEDAEAYILRKVMEKTGGDVPVICTTDLHANISPEMVEFSRCLVGFDTYPHHDYYQRAYDAVRILDRTMRQEINPVSALRKPPLMPVVQKLLTDRDPMRSLMELVHEMESRPGVVNITLAGGFPYADFKWAGMGVVVTTDGDRPLAESLCEEIEKQLWSSRLEFTFSNIPVADGIAIAKQSRAYPFLIVDSSDNVGGGSAGDGTGVLAELLRQNIDSCVIIIRDREAVELADSAGVGGAFNASVGGKTDQLHGPPVYVEGVVRSVSDGSYHSERTGERINMGRTAVVDVGGITLVLTKERVPAFDLETLRSLGINPEKLKYIVVKGAVQWQYSYGSIAAGWVEVDSPGVTSSNLHRFNFTKIRRPIYPLDNI
jgi:microcystin degradation protein MlrC